MLHFVSLDGTMVFLCTMTDEYIIISPVVDKMFVFSKLKVVLNIKLDSIEYRIVD